MATHCPRIRHYFFFPFRTGDKPTLCCEESLYLSLFHACWLYKYPWNRSSEHRAINASSTKHAEIQETLEELASICIYSKPIILLNTGPITSQLFEDFFFLSYINNVTLYYILLGHNWIFFTLVSIPSLCKSEHQNSFESHTLSCFVLTYIPVIFLLTEFHWDYACQNQQWLGWSYELFSKLWCLRMRGKLY